jgi:hypothetical protein
VVGSGSGHRRCFLITLTLSVSLPGLTGQSSTRGRWLLDRPVKPDDDSQVCVNLSEKRSYQQHRRRRNQIRWPGPRRRPGARLQSAAKRDS